MSIDGMPKVGPGRTGVAPATSARAPSVSGGAGLKIGVADPVGSQVEISSSSVRLQEAGETFNAEKVAEIRQAIAEGRFQINPERIADGLLSSVRDMLSGRQTP